MSLWSSKSGRRWRDLWWRGFVIVFTTSGFKLSHFKKKDKKEKKTKKLSKRLEADRCGRSLPCPASGTAWSCCVWEAAFKKHEPEAVVEAQLTQKSSCTNTFTCKYAFFCRATRASPLLSRLRTNWRKSNSGFVRIFSPDATKIQFADERKGSHPLRAVALVRLSLRRGHLKCIRITSIQAPAAFCIALWDLPTWTCGAGDWFVASLKTAESPGGSTQLFMSWLCESLTTALFLLQD